MGTFLILLVSFWLFSIDGSVFAQVGRGGLSGRPGSTGGRSGLGGTRGFSTRSVNPNFNPRGSLSTFGNMNPRGTLSPALNLNPSGSLLRPRTAGETMGTGNRGGATVHHPIDAITAAPTKAQFQLMPRSGLYSWSEFGLQQLEDSLEAYGNSQRWRAYLELDKLEAVNRHSAATPMSGADLTELKHILQRFDRVASEEQYGEVALLSGFSVTRSSLQELVQVDEVEVRHRLILSLRSLDQALVKTRGGRKWQEYFALSNLLTLATGDLAGDPPSKKKFHAGCEKTDQRFEKVLASPDGYRAIIDLPEFRATSENLKAYIEIAQQTSDASAER